MTYLQNIKDWTIVEGHTLLHLASAKADRDCWRSIIRNVLKSQDTWRRRKQQSENSLLSMYYFTTHFEQEWVDRLYQTLI